MSKNGLLFCHFKSSVRVWFAGDLLSSTPSPLPPSPAVATESKPAGSGGGLIDVGEFEELEKVSSTGQQLTSNVAILAGEFAEAKEEEADEFDEAFDALGKSTKLN